MHTSGRKAMQYLSFLIAMFALQPAANAGPLLTLTLDSNAITVKAGDMVTISGAIINRTNADLAESDFILNFSEYDPAILDPVQRLGTTALYLPSFSFLNDIDLFTLAIAHTALPGHYGLRILLQDGFGNLAEFNELAILVDELAVPVPEPTTACLIALGLFMAGIALRPSRGK